MSKQRVVRDPKWSEKLREERKRGERERELRKSAAAVPPRASMESMERCAVCITGRSFHCGTHQALASCLFRPEMLALVALVGSTSSSGKKMVDTRTPSTSMGFHSTQSAGSKASEPKRCQLTSAEWVKMGALLRFPAFSVPVLSVWDAFSVLTSPVGRKPCPSQPQQTTLPLPMTSDETARCVAQLRTWLNVMETFFSGDQRAASISKARVAFLQVYTPIDVEIHLRASSWSRRTPSDGCELVGRCAGGGLACVNQSACTTGSQRIPAHVALAGSERQ